MKIKPLKILARVAQVAAVVGAGVVGGPAASAAVGVALGTGALGKIAGKAVESKTGVRAQKITAPAGALLGGGAAILIDPSLVDTICTVADTVCANRELAVTVPGLVAILVHVLGANILKVGKQ